VSAGHADGTVVAEPGPVDDIFVLWDADVADDDRPSLQVSPAVAPDAPPIWFVHLDDRSDPPATSLVAFDTDDRPPGTVVTDAEFFSMPVRNDQQVAAIRWWHDEAVVDQIYVRPDMRRRQVGTVVIYAASAFHQLNGWPGRLHSDGRRTTMGDALVTALRHPDRIAALTTTMPPMDPPPR
jgi:GNAT superfamily N-acetyltransferase